MEKVWTEKEIQYLKDNYKKMTYREIGDALGRTKSSTKSKGNKLGLFKRKGSRKWSSEDLGFLKENYKDVDFDKLMLKLNRSRSSIDTKAYELNLNRGWKWSDEEVRYLKENYLKYSYIYIGEKLGKSSSVVGDKAISLGLHKPELNLIGKTFGRLTVTKKIILEKGVEWECVCLCGTIKRCSTGNLNSGHIKSCGCLRKDIATEWMINNRSKLKVPKGKNHRWYNPLLTDEERLMVRRNYRRSDQEKFSKLVKERDDFTCQVCYRRGGTLNSHHLNSWNTFPKERFDVSNGITLCTNCHNEFHDSYGRGYNTKKQYVEFKKSKLERG